VKHEQVISNWRAMSATSAPPYDYDEFSRRVQRSTEHAQRTRRISTTVAACALVAVAVGALQRLQTSVSIATSDPNAVAAAQADRASGPAEGAAVPRLAEAAVVKGESYLLAAALEDRMAWIDDTLSDPQVAGQAQVPQLLRERERLLKSWVQVRYAEALVASR